MTGIVVEETWILQEATGNEELLLNDIELLQEDFGTGTSATWNSATWTTSSLTWTTSPKATAPKTTTKPSSSNGLSAQDIRDLKNLLQNFQ
jgi:hypothetical protein